MDPLINKLSWNGLRIIFYDPYDCEFFEQTIDDFEDMWPIDSWKIIPSSKWPSVDEIIRELTTPLYRAIMARDRNGNIVWGSEEDLQTAIADAEEATKSLR